MVRGGNYLTKKTILHKDCGPYVDYFKIMTLGSFYLVKNVK